MEPSFRRNHKHIPENFHDKQLSFNERKLKISATDLENVIHNKVFRQFSNSFIKKGQVWIF